MLDQVGVAGADRAVWPHELRVVARLLGGGEDDGRDGFARGKAARVAGGDRLDVAVPGDDLRPGGERVVVVAVETGEEDDPVLLVARGAVAVAAGPAPVEIVLDVGRAEFQPRGAAEDDGGDGRAVGFPRAGDAEEWSAEKFHGLSQKQDSRLKSEDWAVHDRASLLPCVTVCCVSAGSIPAGRRCGRIGGRMCRGPRRSPARYGARRILTERPSYFCIS